MDEPEYGLLTSRKKAVTIEMIVLLGGILILGSIAGTLWNFSPLLHHSPLLYLLGDLGSLGVLLYILWLSGDDWEMFGIVKPSLSDILPTIVAVVAAVFSAGVLYGLMGSDPLHEFSRPRGWSWVLIVLALVVSSIYQELFTRGYAIARFTEMLGSKALAVVCSSLLFGFWHLYQGPQGMVSSFFFGLLFALIYIQWPRLWPVVIGHTVANLLLHA